MPIEPDTILRGSVPPRQLASDASVFDKRFIITSELTMNESENVGDQLQATENVLRNLIASILSDKLGGEWLVKTGVSQDRYDGWVRKREEEKKKLATGNLETRLLYFADFYDLKTIIVKNWGHFSAVSASERNSKYSYRTSKTSAIQTHMLAVFFLIKNILRSAFVVRFARKWRAIDPRRRRQKIAFHELTAPTIITDIPIHFEVS